MQNAKDSFYLNLRNALAALQPDLTVVLRGSTRPAVLVDENELFQPDLELLDVFRLSWSATSLDLSEPEPLESCVCTIAFSTRGTSELSFMDRGRTFSSLQESLRDALKAGSCLNQDFSKGLPVSEGSNVFWTEPTFGDVAMTDGILSCAAIVHVFAVKKAGEA